MNIIRICMLLVVLVACGDVFAAEESALQIRTAKPGATVSVDRVLKDGEVLISVSDANKEPLLGLGAADFSLTKDGRTAKIKSVKPISESQDVPRHFVLVLDNSNSMKQRDAVPALLAGVSELLKIVRPIDEVQMVVFDDDKTVNMGGRSLHVRTFKSNRQAELRDFIAKTYRDGMTSNTVLYEGMLAGLELIASMPATEPRFMVVFSDGEDINSSFKKEDVMKIAPGVGRFNAYTIDYMPGSEKNKFLADFAANNNGQIWKATSETNLVPIFQSVASKMEYYYVVSYQFPPTGKMAVSPALLTINQLRTADAALATGIDSPELKLQPVIDSVYGIATWKITVSNSKGNVAELAGEGAPAPEVKLPLPTADLQALADGGDLTVKMELQDKNGQDLVLPAAPIKFRITQAQGSLAVAPAVLTVDVVRSMDVITNSGIDTSELTLRPSIDSGDWIANWKITVSNIKGAVTELAGAGAPAAEVKLPLPVTDPQVLAASGDLIVKMELQGRTGQKLVLAAPPVKIRVAQTEGKLAVEPARLTIEEIKTIDASPMLGQIFFSKGSSEIPAQYLRFTAAGETAGFDEQKFRDTLEKYNQLLNIIGKRMTDNVNATITLVGCNDNIGVEKGKKTLSGQRAEAVKNYLQAVWGIAPERMTIEARNLPKMPSTTKSKEGQAENRRVEIIANDPEILAPIRSTYFTTRIDVPALTLRPEVSSPYGIAEWTLSASNAAGNVADLAGKGSPAKETKIPLDGKELRALATAGDITIKMELLDRKGQKMLLSPAPVKVSFIETSKRLAQQQDQRVQEKYALILFDFNKDTISTTNQEIVNKIVDRFKTLPQATISIVGYTDNIGKESYNVKLSERRAAAVNKMLAAAYGESAGDRIRFSGVGPNSPLFDNQLPEGRSFNRTVTITLEYLSQE